MKTKSTWRLLPPEKLYWGTRWPIYYGNIFICAFDSRQPARNFLKVLKEEEKQFQGIPPWE